MALYVWFTSIHFSFSEIVELQKKFEEDKKKIEALKQARKFKPL